jgi:hypothetical protein
MWYACKTGYYKAARDVPVENIKEGAGDVHDDLGDRHLRIAESHLEAILWLLDNWIPRE